MDGHDFIRDIALCILGATALGIPAYIFRIPLVLSYLIAGVLLGPHLGFGLIQGAESIQTVAEIGLVLLMFILGLEIDIRKLLRAGKAVLVTGLVQFIGCALLGIVVFYAIGYRNQGNDYTLTYLAVATSLSSTLVVVKILSDRMELDLVTSRITLGILVLQDLWAITFLAIQPKLSTLDFATVSFSLGKAIVLVLTTWLLAKYVLPGIFRRIGKQPELLIVASMAWCFGICGLASALQLSREMGALVAGVSIASYPYHADIAAKITSLRDFFITLFFVGLGLQIPLPSAHVLGLALLIVVFIYFSRLLTIFPVLHGLRYGHRASLVPVINLSQLSEFSLVLAAIGITYKHISPDTLAAFILALVFSLLISSFLIPKSYDVYLMLAKAMEKFGIRDRIMAVDINKHTEGSQHKIVVVGFYREASSFLQEFIRRHTHTMLEQLLVVDYNPETLDRLRAAGVACKYGDVGHAETLKHLHLDQALVLISTVPDSRLKGTDNRKILKTLKALAPHARVVVTAETLEAAREMYREGADYVFLPRIVSAHYLVDVLERVQSDRMDAIRQGAMKFLNEWDELLP